MRYPRVIVIKSGNKVADYWNHRGGRFFDQPMARAFDDLAANVGRDEFRLLYQECAAGLLTRQDQHGHGEPRTCQPRKVLRVALEISKILKACPHRARLRIRPGVKSDLWHFHFYGEVPLALVKGRERIYLEHFWNDFAVHEHDPLGPLWELSGVSIGHHQPDIMADDADTLQIERRGQLVDVHGHVLLVISGRWLRRSSRAPQVRHDKGVTLREQRHDRTPHVAGLREAVQQDHRTPLPADEVAQPHAVDLSEALGEATTPRHLLLRFVHSTPPARRRRARDDASRMSRAGRAAERDGSRLRLLARFNSLRFFSWPVVSENSA